MVGAEGFEYGIFEIISNCLAPFIDVGNLGQTGHPTAAPLVTFQKYWQIIIENEMLFV